MYKFARIITVLFFIFLVSQKIFAATNYVSKSGGHISPFSNWLTAATNIQSAVDAAQNGDTILVTNGIYDTGGAVTPDYKTFNRVMITNQVTVRSVSGHEATIIQGAGPEGKNAIRCAYLTTNSKLIGFTLSNGHTRTSTDNIFDESGGAALLVNGGSISNCVITKSSANRYGGGVYCYYGGVILDSSITHNNAIIYGGGLYFAHGGTAMYCIIKSNNANNDGGGIYCDYGGIADNCKITENFAKDDGGGIYYRNGGSAVNCIISGNSASDGGAMICVYGGKASNCKIINNFAHNDGGGLYCYSGYGIFNNCLIQGNSAGNDCGGLRLGSSVKNCTIIENSAKDRCGGIWCSTSSKVKNSIIYYNSAAEDANYYRDRFEYCCTTPASDGLGNINEKPLFLLDGYSRLSSDSPCINSGANAYAVGDTDVDGNTRIQDGQVDIGAYEYGTNLVCALNADKRTGINSLDVQFVSKLAGYETNNSYYFWDIDCDSSIDFEGLNANAPKYTYKSIGNYSVCLKVSNNIGEVATTIKENYINIIPPLAADFYANLLSGAAPCSIQFYDTTANQPQFWSWDFNNDGIIDSTAQHPSHTFSVTGIFNVALTVSNYFGSNNADGGWSVDSIIKTNYLTVTIGSDLIPQFSVDKTNVGMYEEIQFTDETANNPLTWEWDFENDGIVDSTIQNPIIKFSSEGDKSVRLTVSKPYREASIVYTNFVHVDFRSEINVQSQNPNSDVAIAVIKSDIYGETNGLTPFMRTYDSKTNITFRAPETVNNKNFHHWELDDSILSNIPTITINSTGIHSLKAVYYTTLQVRSLLPDTNMLIRVNIEAKTTPFDINYYTEQNVFLVANDLARWTLDDIEPVNNEQTFNLTMDKNHILYVSFTGYVRSDTWKHIRKRTKDVLIGKKILPKLEQYFENGWMISMLDGETSSNFNGPHSLISKRKGKKWNYKIPKKVDIRYVTKRQKLIYKVWESMPKFPLIYLSPPLTNKMLNISSEDSTQKPIGFYLTPANPNVTTGWQRLIPTIYRTSIQE